MVSLPARREQVRTMAGKGLSERRASLILSASVTSSRSPTSWPIGAADGKSPRGLGYE